MKTQRGLTLIELLVVLAIMMTLVSLVGGTTYRSLQKAEAQTELISFFSLIKKSGALAFSSGKDVVLQLSGNEITILNGDSVAGNRTFEHISFEGNNIVFNRNGFLDTQDILLSVLENERTVDLLSITNPLAQPEK